MARCREDQAAIRSKKMRKWKTEMGTAKKVNIGEEINQPAKHIVEVATDTQVHEKFRRHVTSPLKRSATSSRKHQQARPVPIRRQHPTTQTRK
ncbi:LOW QUALITY PROTEIN: hypothetical protein HID58_085155 [Brassica napus]|uniref:Uncharacterized protein n=1 Tax=Brassica napus TaxID=3708 RepID=A0ABQ7XLT7_BRANA|nr:LOW QUALITY PROTEIN: hypothetical protein HID58_085155 [Brassica napus]